MNYEPKTKNIVRIVGKINDVIYNPPSLMLNDAIELTVQIDYEESSHQVKLKKERKKYGLVFSQITYFEPIDDYVYFMNNDDRVT